MNGPRRLVDQSASEFERSLLHAARGGRPTTQARRRTLKAVAAGASALGAAAAGSGSVMASVGFAAALKWGALGVIVAAAVSVGGAEAWRASATPPSTATPGAARVASARGAAVQAAAWPVAVQATASNPSATGSPEAVRALAAEVPGAASELTATLPEAAAAPAAQQAVRGEGPPAMPGHAAAPLPPASTPVVPAPGGDFAAIGAGTPSARSPGPGTPSASLIEGSGAAHRGEAFPAGPPHVEPATVPGRAAASDARTLADEVSALDRARAALDAADADGALRALESRQRRHGAGRMGPEATLLRIRALLAKGDRQAAAALAAAQLAADPHGPFAARIRGALADSNKSSPRR